jgi:hypothetical protein
LNNVQAQLVNGIRVNAVNAAPSGSVNSPSVSLLVQQDFDGDGVGDAWEASFGFNTNSGDDGALDFDQDGMSNRDEFVAGTNPTNATSVLKLTAAIDTGALLFTAETNKTYSVQTRTNLNSAAWSNDTNIFATTQQRTIQVPVPPALPNPERYYRVVTPVVP